MFAPGVDDLRELLSVLDDVTEWHLLGLHLGLKESTLEAVACGFRKPWDAKREILKLWLKQDDQIPAAGAGTRATWRSLIEALKAMGYNVIAKKIEDEV